MAQKPTVITTLEELTDLVNYYSTVDAFAFDVETVGTYRDDPIRNDVLWISFATYGRADVIPLGHPNGDFVRLDRPLTAAGLKRKEKGLPLREDKDYLKDDKKATPIFTAPPEQQLTPAEAFSALKPLFFSDALKIGHNIKFDLESVAKYIGGLPSTPYADTYVASVILSNLYKYHYDLAACVKRYVGYSMQKGIGENVEKHSFDEVAKYSYLDAKYTWLLWLSLKQRLQKDGMSKLFLLEMDLLEVICEMELYGARLDMDALQEVKDSLEKDIDEIVGRIYKAAGRVFNLNSNVEKQQILFSPKSEGGRGLKPRLLTPKGDLKQKKGLPLGISDYAVSEDALRYFAGKDELVDALLEYSNLNKLLTTYVVPYIGGEVKRTTKGKTKTVQRVGLAVNGRVHGEFKQVGTVTGRLSSNNPNLQNIPNPSNPRGKQIRNLFVAGPGNKLIAADYSQIEPRVIASFSGDKGLLQTYLSGEDIYTYIGNAMGVDRASGKVLVLGMSYGIGSAKIAADIGCSIQKAKNLLATFDNRFRSVARYKQKVIAEARSLGYATTVLGRRRYLPDLRSHETGLRARAERQAFNTRIQGSAADIIKLAMIRAYRMIPEEAHIILTVHDEIVVECPATIVEDAKEALREAMEGIHLLSVPLVADVKIVDKWGDAK